jgi:hypothetical protein
MWHLTKVEVHPLDQRHQQLAVVVVDIILLMLRVVLADQVVELLDMAVQLQADLLFRVKEMLVVLLRVVLITVLVAVVVLAELVAMRAIHLILVMVE